jgi:D-glucuronyl C5-epimerase-like protein
MPTKGSTLLATLVCALALSASAQASPVIEVGGGHTVVRNDPVVPPPEPEPELGAVAVAARKPKARGYRAVLRSLLLARRTRKISAASYRRYVRDYRKARSVRRRLRGARGSQLGYVIASIESIALRKRLTSSRLASVFLTLRRNTQYWPRMRFPAAKDQLTFRGSQILFQYYPGRGLQIQQLSTFKKANLMHGACTGALNAPCDRAGLQSLLDEESRLAVRRSSKFIAWEYLFDFGGGSPPWISGMADATAIQALGRAAKLLNRPQYLKTARNALGAFDTYAPLGVRTTGFRGGTHYLQYSFAPRTYIFNAFTQSLIGLYDYWKLTGDTRARAQYDRAEPELAREVPYSDVGDWSLYNYRGPESDSNYHELLREVLQSMCSRKLGEVYCTYAMRYRDDQTQPATLELLGPETATADQDAFVSFELSKLSAVEITIVKDGKTAFHKVITFRRGRRGFTWKPKSAGTYDVRLGAKELRTGNGLRTRASGTIDVG